MYEVARSGSMDSTALANLAKQYVGLGADVLCVRIDSEDTPEGMKDLFAVSRAVKCPVMARDYLIHPLQVERVVRVVQMVHCQFSKNDFEPSAPDLHQVVEIKESGAAGALGVITQVNGRGTAVLSSFAAALGLDAPVEVGTQGKEVVVGKHNAKFPFINFPPSPPRWSTWPRLKA